jgi:hypothetical protein
MKLMVSVRIVIIWYYITAIFKTGNPGIGESDKNFIGFKLKFKFQVKSSDTPKLQMLRYVPALALVLFATTVHEHDLLLVSVFEVELKLSIFPYNSNGRSHEKHNQARAKYKLRNIYK